MSNIIDNFMHPTANDIHYRLTSGTFDVQLHQVYTDAVLEAIRYHSGKPSMKVVACTNAGAEMVLFETDAAGTVLTRFNLSHFGERKTDRVLVYGFDCEQMTLVVSKEMDTEDAEDYKRTLRTMVAGNPNMFVSVATL